MLRSVSNPPSPWRTQEVEWLGEPPPVELQVFEESARTILSRNDSPDLPFTWSVNPYRGCQHACAYCYARPTHQFLDWGAGTDFDSKIVVKVNAAERLREAFARRSWRRELVAFSGVTDCYQPLEASYRVTRACLEVAAEFRNPVAIVTKGALVRRDLDVLARLAHRARVQVFLSIPFADDATGRALEPWGASPTTRFETLRALSDAGIETGVSISPLIPGLNEPAIPEILGRAREAGARSAFLTLLRLPAEVAPVFEERLRAAFPDRAERVLHAVEELRGGKRNEGAFGARMVGSGPRWEAISRLFEIHRRRLGLEGGDGGFEDSLRRDAKPRQATLFDV